MNHQEMKEMFDGYMNEMEKQTAILKHLEEQQEIIIEQNAKISATLERLAEHVQITFFFLGMEQRIWHHIFILSIYERGSNASFFCATTFA